MSVIANEVVAALREEFGLADNRDLAVAQAVRDWYLAQFPHMRVLIDQPNLAGIIAKVRQPAPANPAVVLGGIIASEVFANAQRYLVLRNLPDELLGATGVPGIAVPEGPDHGNFVSSDDADRIIDAYIARVGS
jgi:hypothetical protein